MKNKLFIIINVFGMGIAIACCIVAYLNWDFTNSWDSNQLKAEKIYRVQSIREFQGKRERHGLAPIPLANYIKQNFKDVDKTVRYMSAYCDMRIGDNVYGANTAFVDSAFFDLFNYELKHGTFADFHSKGKIFISDEVARTYFNSEDVVGRTVSQIILGKDGVRRPKEFEIGGVFKRQPLNSTFRAQVITLYDNFWDINLDSTYTENNWRKWTHALFLEIDDPSSVAGIEQRLQQYIEPQNKVRDDFKLTSYHLENFKGMMKRSRQNPRVDSDYLGGGVPDEAVTAPSILAGMLLLLACFNFTNTSIAISSQRLKEIGIRKVMGGMRFQLIAQFLGENLILCFLGLIAGLLMAEFLVPAYDSLWEFIDLNLSYTENIGFLLFLAGLLVLTAIIAGAYPSFYITSFEPVSILKGKSKFGGTSWFTRILLGGQFVISLTMLITGLAFYRNGHYQKEYDMGFASHGVISVWVNNEGSFNTYRDALVSNPDILVIAGTRHHISNGWNNDPVKFEDIEKEIDIMDVGDNYFEAMDMTLTSGRKFQKDSETDRKESIIVTEQLVQEFGWKDNPIGKRLVWHDTVQLFVIGVVKNVYARALWEPTQPLMIRYTAPSHYQQLIAKMDPAKVGEVNAYMEKKWKEINPNAQYPGEMIDSELQETNEINNNVVIMFGFLGFFGALMTGIGLYTLVSLNIVKKMKEIGVRKVLGASVGNIATVINYEFMVNLAIATIIGGALGYFMTEWLMDSIWEYYLKIGALSISLAVITMVGISVLAVGYKTVSTASLNPTKTLRDE
ncbi:MAG: FtsX-like permease family protein [Cyclobacteriaceae bacterium]|nr:FtsX-like permease family protein [Cyclobacteriaceae bacterium]